MEFANLLPVYAQLVLLFLTDLLIVLIESLIFGKLRRCYNLFLVVAAVSAKFLAVDIFRLHLSDGVKPVTHFLVGFTAQILIEECRSPQACLHLDWSGSQLVACLYTVLLADQGQFCAGYMRAVDVYARLGETVCQLDVLTLHE